MTDEDKTKVNPTPVPNEEASDTELKEGIDYYVENGFFVFTAAFLLKRGYCCESGCRHCPYGYMKNDPTKLSP